MKSVKTARGRTIDMSALAAKNDKERAVSNVPVNARGDIIDSRGNVKVPREKVTKEFYKDNVPGADTKETSIKEESAVKPIANAPKEENNDPIEISRVERERSDGSKFWEIEYSDGSMEEVNI